MAIGVSRTVLVGLGGTGVKTLLRIKGEFIENFGEVPNIIQFRAFDTANSNSPENARRVDGQPITLSPNEFEKFQVRGVEEVVEKSDAIQNWIPSEDKINLLDILNGCGGRRSSGRVALFHHAPSIYNSIESACQAVEGVALKDKLGDRFKLRENEPLRVFVVSSLAGGTGSGMFLDVGHMARDILGEDGDIIGTFLNSGIFSGIEGQPFIQGNNYAALKELDYWLNQDSSGNKMEVEYPGLHSITWGGYLQPFDYPYIVDNKMEGGERFNNIENMLDFLAQGVFLHLTVQSSGAEDFWSNLAAKLEAKKSEKMAGKRPRYTGFGLNSLSVPIKRQVNISANETAIKNLIEPLTTNLGGSWAEDEVEQFRTGENLDQDGLRSSIVPSEIELPNGGEMPSPPEAPHTESPEAIKRWRDSCIESWNNAIAKLTSEENEEYQNTLLESKQALKDRVDYLLHQEGGVTKLKSFLEELKEQLNSENHYFREEVNKEKADRESVEYPEEQLEKAFHPRPWFIGIFVKRSRVSNAVAKFEGKIKEQGRHMLNYTRFKVANNLTAELLSEINNYNEMINKLENSIEKAKGALSSELEKLRDKETSQVTVQELDIEFIKSSIRDAEERVDVDLMFRDAREEDPEGLIKWANKRPQEIAQKFRDVAHQKLSHIEEDDIDRIMQRRLQDGEGQSGQTHPLQKTVERATTFWGDLRTGAAGQAGLIDLYIMGLPTREEGLADKAITSALEGEKLAISTDNVYLAGTWDKFKIRVLHLRTPVSLSALQKVRDYRDEYYEKEDGEEYHFTHHIHKDWVGVDSLPDLLPKEQ